MKEILETLEKLMEQVRESDEVDGISVYVGQNDFHYTVARKEKKDEETK